MGTRELPKQRSEREVGLVPDNAQTNENVKGLVAKAYRKTGAELYPPAEVRKIGEEIRKKSNEHMKTSYDSLVEHYKTEGRGELDEDYNKMLTAVLGEVRAAEELKVLGEGKPSGEATEGEKKKINAAVDRVRGMFDEFTEEQKIRAVSWWDARQEILEAPIKTPVGTSEQIYLSVPWNITAMCAIKFVPPKITLEGVNEAVGEIFSRIGETMGNTLGEELIGANQQAHQVDRQNQTTEFVDLGLPKEISSRALPILIKHLNAEAKERELPLIFGQVGGTGNIVGVWDYTGTGQEMFARREPTEFQKERMA